MKRFQIKVCGNNNKENFQSLVDLEPNYVGFIFYDKSKRFVDDLSLFSIFTNAEKVGVFVNESIPSIIQKVIDYKLDVVQLHGDETVKLCEELISTKHQYLLTDERFLDFKIWKAIGIKNEKSFKQLTTYQQVVDCFVFDTKSNDYGGTGKKFDWQLLTNYQLSTPFLLSGGIKLKDALLLKNFQHPKCIGFDINSGFETEPGLKKIKEIKEFINVINRRIEQNSNQMKYEVNEKGFYGDFGGAFIPELLHHNCEELADALDRYIETKEFKKEFNLLLKDYVGRPSPLYYAPNLSKRYNTTILLKREDLNHTGAHKINNAIGQALLAKQMGKTKIIAETGAGQHGVATATVCALLGLKCTVFMGEIDIKRQAPNVARMKMLGAEVISATSGSKTLKDATNEAIRYWINNPETFYIIGSVVGPHPYPAMVTKFQAIISEEIKLQMKEKYRKENPDYVIACVGGGSNAAGAFYHFLDNENVKLIAVEAAGLGVESGKTAATTVKGTEGIIHGSRTLLMQNKDGQIVEPYSISAGLDYPGVGPLHAHLFKSGRAEFLNATDDEALKAAFLLTKEEGIIPALESSHALAALEKIYFKPQDIVILNLSGRGDKDLETYMKVSEKYSEKYLDIS